MSVVATAIGQKWEHRTGKSGHEIDRLDKNSVPSCLYGEHRQWTRRYCEHHWGSQKVQNAAHSRGAYCFYHERNKNIQVQALICHLALPRRHPLQMLPENIKNGDGQTSLNTSALYFFCPITAPLSEEIWYILICSISLLSMGHRRHANRKW